MGNLNFRYRLVWSFGLIAVLLFSFSALTPHGDTKSSAERFLKIAKWKLRVSWQASGNFADTLAGEGVTLNVVSSVGVNGRGEYLLVKRPDDGPYEWGTPEGDNPNVSVSYDGRKTHTSSGATLTLRNVWSYESEKPDGGSAKLEIHPDTGTFDVYAVIHFIRKDISPPSGSRPEINHVSISMTPVYEAYRKKNMLPDSGFNLSGSHEFLAGLDPLNDVDPQVTKKKLPLMAPWAQMKVNWQLAPAGEENVEAVIETPEDYENWLPVAEKTEDKAGPKPITVKVRLHKKGEPDKPAAQKAQFKFELVKTTKEKGVCLNSPPADKALDTYDLRIEQDKNEDLDFKDDQDNEGQKAETKEKDLSEAAVTISCFDWGAYTKLKVTAILDDGNEILAHLEGKPQQKEMVIPLDENNNRVADGWEKEKNIYDRKLPAHWDGAEEPKGQKAPGDGISLYEKYRGFEFEGIHERLDPNYKYLFVYDRTEIVRRLNSDSPQTVLTIGDVIITNESVLGTRFSTISKLRLRYVDDDHWTGPGSSGENKRIVNFNTGWKDGHAVDQHALDIEADSSEKGTFALPFGYQDARKRAGKEPIRYAPTEDQGFAYPDIGGRFGSPKQTYRIVIYVNRIFDDIFTDTVIELEGTLWSGEIFTLDEEEIRRIREFFESHPRELGERLVKQQALVLTHEMSHGVGVRHHETDSGKEECVMTRIKPEAQGGANDPFRLKTEKPWPHELCIKPCWSQVIVSDLADKKAGK